MLKRLYPEILSYILILAQEASTVVTDAIEESDPGFSSSAPGPPPMQPFEITVSHVNSQLRDVAMCTAPLWSRIYINTSVHSSRVVLERTEAYLQRSVGHLLDLRIELNGPAADGDRSFVAATTGEMSRELYHAMEIIALESKRWKRLVIIAEYEGFMGGSDALIARLNEAHNGKCKSGGLVPQLEYLFVSADCVNESPAPGGANGANGGEAHAAFAPTTVVNNHHVHPQQLSFGGIPHSVPNEAPFTPIVHTSPSPKMSFLRLRGLAVFLLRPNWFPVLRTLHLDQTKAIPMDLRLFTKFAAACPMLENLSVYGDIVTPSTGVDGGAGLHMSHSVLGTGHTQQQQGGVSLGSEGGQQRKGLNGNENRRAICFPQLRSLRICGIRGLTYRVLLSQLEAPKLRSLVLKDAQEHDLDAIWEELFFVSFTNDIGRGGIKTFLARPASRFTQMRSLTISSSDLSKFTCQRLLKTFPRITEFASYSSMELDVALSLFVDDTRVNMPCPNLRTLAFIFDIDLAADDVMIADMLSKRKMLGSPIRKLRIGVSELDTDGIVEEDSSAHDAIVILEKLDEFDIWPSDRVYPDVDDVLF